MEKDEEYTCKTFSLALPAGSNRADLARLLESFAEQVRNTEIEDVLDLTFQSEVDDDAQEVFSLTLYYR